MIPLWVHSSNLLLVAKRSYSVVRCFATTYRLLGELGSAGLRAPPECVADPQPDLDNASEGKASIAASMHHLYAIHGLSVCSTHDLPLLLHL